MFYFDFYMKIEGIEGESSFIDSFEGKLFVLNKICGDKQAVNFYLNLLYR